MNPHTDSSPDIPKLHVALIGYGEVGGIFAAAIAAARVAAVTAFDIKATDAAWMAQARRRATRDGVHLASSNAEAVADADLVISAVTAAQTSIAAEQIARNIRGGAFLLDVNSASPQTKTACADVVARAGGRYVEAAVMTSVPPYGIRVPMLLGGLDAQALLPTLAALGFDAKVGAEKLGVVSAIKLCRSVVIKGMEALMIESLLTARRYGVEKEVLASLAETFPTLDWEKQSTWFWRRVVLHGKRRAEEMREAAVTVANVGISPRMATATADLQSWVATLRAAGVFDDAGAEAGWREHADRVRTTADQDAN